MLRYLYGRDDDIAAVVAARIPGCDRGFGRCRTIGIVDEAGNLIAGLVYHHYNPEAGVIDLSVAAISPRWLTPATLQRMYSYPFDRCGCQLLLHTVRADNARLLRILFRAGTGKLHRIRRLYGRDQDGIVWALTDDEWRASRFYRDRERRAA